MGKTLKRVVLGIFLFALVVSLVYASQVIDDYKVEKCGNKICIYKLIEVTDDKKIREKEDKLDQKILKLEEEKNNLDMYYEACMYMCPITYADAIKEMKEDAKMFCEADCDTERYFTREYLNKEIERKEDEKASLDFIK